MCAVGQLLRAASRWEWHWTVTHKKNQNDRTKNRIVDLRNWFTCHSFARHVSNIMSPCGLECTPSCLWVRQASACWEGPTLPKKRWGVGCECVDLRSPKCSRERGTLSNKASLTLYDGNVLYIMKCYQVRQIEYIVIRALIFSLNSPKLDPPLHVWDSRVYAYACMNAFMYLLASLPY